MDTTTITANPVASAAIAVLGFLLLHLKGVKIPLVSDVLTKLLGAAAAPLPPAPAPGSNVAKIATTHPLLVRAGEFLGSALPGPQVEAELEALVNSWQSRVMPPPTVAPVPVATLPSDPAAAAAASATAAGS